MLDTYLRWTDKLQKFILRFVGVLIVLLVFLTVEQVFARYFWDASSVALQELEWHLFAGIILLGAAPTLAAGDHVRVDIVHGRLSESKQICIDLFGYLFFALPTLVVLFWVGYEYTLQSLDYQNIRPPDHFTSAFLGQDSSLYEWSTRVESWLRKYIFMGEVSPDPGGLEGRWILKGLIPCSAVLLLLQSIAQILKALTRLKHLSTSN